MFDFLKSLPDPRSKRKKKYVMAEMLACMIIAIMCRNTTGITIFAWCKDHLDYLRSLGLVLDNGIASYDTHMRLLRIMDQDALCGEFLSWANDLLLLSGVHLAIDGKGLRGGTQRVCNGKIPYMLNVIEISTGFVIASFPIEEKTNEIRAIPKILEMIAITGNLITIDAIGTNTNILGILEDGEADYVMLVKKNNPEAYESLRCFFTKRSEESSHKVDKGTTTAESNTRKNTSSSPELEMAETKYEDSGWVFERNRERDEYRRTQVITHQVANENDCNWPEAEMALCPTSSLGEIACLFGTIGWSTNVRVPVEKDPVTKDDITRSREDYLKFGSHRNPRPPVSSDSETSAYQEYGIISNRILSPEEVMRIKRAHWACEAAHHVLDVTFREDENPAHSSKFAFSILRKICHNLVRWSIATGELQDEHSTPVELVHLESKPDLQKKLLFGNLNMLRISKR